MKCLSWTFREEESSSVTSGCPSYDMFRQRIPPPGTTSRSFDGHQSFLPDRFIEVKTFQGTEHFYWSAAEIAAAEELQDKYCLYLVDRKLIELPGYAPRIIRNPTVALFESDPEWSVKAFNFAIEKHSLEDR